jgi:hypothetical protein
MQKELNRLTKNISAEFNLQYLDLVAQPDIFGLTPVSPAANIGRTRRLGSRP